MLSEGQAGEIFSRIKTFASADEVEVLFYSTANALTRFANNVIHQNMAEQNVVVSVRTAFGQRTARATTNKLDDESLKRVVEASQKLARVQQADRGFAANASRRGQDGRIARPHTRQSHTIFCGDGWDYGGRPGGYGGEDCWSREEEFFDYGGSCGQFGGGGGDF